MPEKRLALCLVDASNDFQQLPQADAEAAARRLGLGFETRFSSHDLAAQLSELGAVIGQKDKPAAVLALAVRDRGLDRVAREAIRAGINLRPLAHAR